MRANGFSIIAARGGCGGHGGVVLDIGPGVLGIILIAVLGCGLAAEPAHAAPAKRDCSKAAMRKVRAHADKAATAKDYARAISLLEPFLADCHDAKTLADRAWLASDLAVAYEKNGQLVECQRVLAPLSHPSSGLAEKGSDKLVKAIQHNLDHCSKALDAKYAAIKPGGCTLTVDKAIATAAVPAALVPKGATAACVALVRGKPAPKAPDDDPESRDVVCPVVALLWKGAKPALERQELTASGTGALGDDSVCCNLSSIAAGTLDGKILVRVRGQGRDCNGGTADSAADTFYDWTGSALRATLDASVGFH